MRHSFNLMSLLATNRLGGGNPKIPDRWGPVALLGDVVAVMVPLGEVSAVHHGI